MLSFTPRGAVRTPDTLQIRVGAGDAGALRAGAPVPSRALTRGEVAANLAAFTTGRSTTRTRPCTRLVLSGCSDADLVESIELARKLGIRHVTLHGAAEPEVVAVVDRQAVRLLDPLDLDGLPAHPALTLVVPLVEEVYPVLPAIGAVLERRRPDEVVFSWPFPGPSVAVRPVEEATAAVSPVIDRLIERGIRARLGGLPACLGGPRPRGEAARTRNRFYVDADHQEEAARMFFPDLVELAKPDTCRVCPVTAWCDGVARAWLDAGRVGVLQPIASSAGGG